MVLPRITAKSLMLLLPITEPNSGFQIFNQTPIIIILSMKVWKISSKHHSQSSPSTLTNPTKIIYLIKKLKNWKSPVLTRLIIQPMKHLPLNTVMFFTSIFNCCIKPSYPPYPALLKHTIIILIHKPNTDPSLHSNYHAISLLVSLEKHINHDRFSDYIYDNILVFKFIIVIYTFVIVISFGMNNLTSDTFITLLFNFSAFLNTLLTVSITISQSEVFCSIYRNQSI